MIAQAGPARAVQQKRPRAEGEEGMKDAPGKRPKKEDGGAEAPRQDRGEEEATWEETIHRARQWASTAAMGAMQWTTRQAKEVDVTWEGALARARQWASQAATRSRSWRPA